MTDHAQAPQLTLLTMQTTASSAAAAAPRRLCPTPVAPPRSVMDGGRIRIGAGLGTKPSKG